MTTENENGGDRSTYRIPAHGDRMQRMVRPKELESDEEQDWSGGRGTDVWAMLTAAMGGDLTTVKKLVAKDPRLSTCCYQYRTPLHFAVQENQIEVVKFLLGHGTDAAYVSGNYWHMQPLVIAEERGYHELHQVLAHHLSQQAGVSSAGERIAENIRGRDVDAVRALLEAEPGLIDAGDQRGNRPIHWGVMIRSIAMIDLVLEKGADINAVRPDGAKPLDLSHGDYFYRGWRDVPSVALLAHDMLIGYLIARGATYDIAVAAKVGDTERVRQLLERDPSLANTVPLYSTYYSGLPLRNACASGDMATVQVLLEFGADPSTPEPGIAPKGGSLHAAASKGDLEIAKLLLERGADPNAEVESSGNCMHIARGDTSMLTLLAAFGGEYADYEDLSKLSPAALESVYGDELPLRYYVDTAELDILAARMGEDPGIAGEVLELALRSYDGAAKTVVRLCLDRDRSTAKRIQANGLIYTLHRLSVKDEKEMTEIIGWLLAAGMNPNDSDWLRVTTLHRLAIGTQPHGSDGSIYRPHPEVMRLFLEAGADLEAKDEEFHSTPLGWAARWGRTEMVEVLLSAGAATNLNDDLAWATPLAWARKKGHEHIARMLMAEGATA